MEKVPQPLLRPSSSLNKKSENVLLDRFSIKPEKIISNKKFHPMNSVMEIEIKI